MRKKKARVPTCLCLILSTQGLGLSIALFTRSPNMPVTSAPTVLLSCPRVAPSGLGSPSSPDDAGSWGTLMRSDLVRRGGPGRGGCRTRLDMARTDTTNTGDGGLLRPLPEAGRGEGEGCKKSPLLFFQNVFQKKSTGRKKNSVIFFSSPKHLSAAPGHCSWTVMSLWTWNLGSKVNSPRMLRFV